MINSYKFGVIVIDDTRYMNDVIVFPERVIDGWWRKEGHKLHVEDLDEIFRYEPQLEVLVVGTGYYGLLKVSSEVENALKSQKIELVSQLTKEACQTFNKILKSNRRVVGAFHLTC